MADNYRTEWPAIPGLHGRHISDSVAEFAGIRNYEVRDVMNRLQHPKLDIQLFLNNVDINSCNPIPISITAGLDFTESIPFLATIYNNSSSIAVHAVVNFFFDKQIKVDWNERNISWEFKADSTRTFTNGASLTEITYRHNGNINLPIFNGVNWRLTPQMTIKFPKMDVLGGIHYIGYEVLTPNMPRKAVIFTLFNNNSSLVLVDTNEKNEA